MNALIESSYWKSSAFMWTYDDWGGWYDHVKPPQVDKFGYGFRVPGAAREPIRAAGYIDHTTLDFTSILKFIEENWNLKPLASRDANANSIAGAFDFTAAPRSPAIVRRARVTAAHPEALDHLPGVRAIAVVLTALLIALPRRTNARRRGHRWGAVAMRAAST